MTLKDLAIAAAEEQRRHEAEQLRIENEQRLATFTTEATAWLVSTFVAPDEFRVDPVLVFSSREAGHVRWDDQWFTIRRERFNYALHPSEPCPSEPDAWHHVDASLFGLSGDRGITTLQEMGVYSLRVITSPRGPSVGRCRHCDRALGSTTDTQGNLWVGVPTYLGDLPQMAAASLARNQEG